MAATQVLPQVRAQVLATAVRPHLPLFFMRTHFEVFMVLEQATTVTPGLRGGSGGGEGGVGG